MLSARPGPRTSTCTCGRQLRQEDGRLAGRVAAARRRPSPRPGTAAPRGGWRCRRCPTPSKRASSAASACGSWAPVAMTIARVRTTSPSVEVDLVRAVVAVEAHRACGRSPPRRRTSRACVQRAPRQRLARDARWGSRGSSRCASSCRPGRPAPCSRAPARRAPPRPRTRPPPGPPGPAPTMTTSRTVFGSSVGAQAERRGQPLDGRVPQHVPALAEHDRDLVDPDLKAIEQRLHVGLGFDVLVA